jgi:hypothetical protein
MEAPFLPLVSEGLFGVSILMLCWSSLKRRIPNRQGCSGDRQSHKIELADLAARVLLAHF